MPFDISWHAAAWIGPQKGEPRMNRKTYQVIASTEKAVKRLIEECRKHGPLYVQNPQVVAHVSRTSKWLLNAIGKLQAASVRPGSDATLAQP
jgi:hypothetical protein